MYGTVRKSFRIENPGTSSGSIRYSAYLGLGGRQKKHGGVRFAQNTQNARAFRFVPDGAYNEKLYEKAMFSLPSQKPLLWR